MAGRSGASWIVGLVALASVAESAQAQRITAVISSDRAVVGEVLTLQVTIQDPSQATAPTAPRTKDFDIQIMPDSPSRGENVSIVNGRMSRTVRYTYVYSVRPLREGALTIPSFTYRERGQEQTTRPIRVTVGRGESGPHILCFVKTEAKVAYVGQPVEMTLEVWIRKFQQRGTQELDVGTMWSKALRDMRSSTWGVFGDANIDEPKYYETQRADDAGVRQEFYVYLLEATVYPTKAGPFEYGDIEFVYQYPVELTRDVFGRYGLARSRRMSVRADAPALVIKSIPQEGRPADFNGAIGKYSIRTTAKPTEVPVGDPITLTLSIMGDGPLDRLTSPRLNQVEALTKDFEVSEETPAGAIEGNRKTFTVTIRALREDVKEIPPIPLSFFDTERGEFKTSFSPPIPVKVTPAQRLALSQLQRGETPAMGVLAPLVETTEGLLANYDDPAEVLVDQSATLGAFGWTVFGLMPVAYLATWVFQTRASRLRNDEAFRRRSRALTTAMRRLEANGHEGEAHSVRAALLGYVSDCCNYPSGGMTRVDAVQLARERAVPESTVQELDHLLESLELAEYGGMETGGAGSLGKKAAELIDEMERANFR